MMFLLLTCFASVAASPNLPVVRTTQIFPSGRIVGGKITYIGNHPYQVSVEFFDRHICGGTIIDATFILTAAHCVGTNTKHYTVRSGTSFRGIFGTVHNVKTIVQHENYTVNRFGLPVHDIALLEVKEPFEFGTIRKAIEPFQTGQEAKAGAKAVVTGWGLTAPSTSAPILLREVSLPIVSKEACNKPFTKYGGLPVGQICAAFVNIGGRGACYGDSGGPLTVDGKLAGLVSWGIGCGSARFPGVYTEVAYYYEWIKKTMANGLSKVNDTTYDQQNHG